ncbi:DUF5984 family protein [Peterkaempfera sp. SMS 1(5)a]|uniref:DUF5984 family protein n=1 Tax=Peterkaempfera podocarpi TaxID=3232308 RepID=UPI00366BF82A
MARTRTSSSPSPATGEVSAATDAFLAALTAFERDLIAAMDLGVAGLETQGPPPGVSLDLQQPHQEHQDRAAWLQRALDRAVATDWDAVREGVRRLWPAGQPQPQPPGGPPRADS